MSKSGPAGPSLSRRLKEQARELGFDLVGIAPAIPSPGYPDYLRWLERGHDAGMAYLRRQAPARANPESILAGVKSVVMAAMLYQGPEPPPPGPTQGKVARYARGRDYHEVLWRRLEALLDWLRDEVPSVVGRAVADTAPLLERDFARLAGLGWIGKNTMLIHKRLGSYTVLGALLLDCELAYDPPHETSHCGTCTRCLDACPTGAFVGPGELDANRCISYWTIEHRGEVPSEIAGQLNGWVFGCDICQEVCPWNRKAPQGREPALQPADGWTHPDLIAWLDAEPTALRREIKTTSMRRAKPMGLVRNAALVLGANRAREAEPALRRRRDDPDPAVRAAVAWALDQLSEGDGRVQGDSETEP
jgi:epoxyqueuosine reductase